MEALSGFSGWLCSFVDKRPNCSEPKGQHVTELNFSEGGGKIDKPFSKHLKGGWHLPPAASQGAVTSGALPFEQDHLTPRCLQPGVLQFCDAVVVLLVWSYV